VPGVAAAVPGSGDGGFGEVLASQVDSLQASQASSAALAQKAATGDVKDIHDYMIASTETQLMTETVVALRNKAVEAFNEILRMPV
jgi:flagellar hook-basal body complex protein FliE